MTMFIPINKAGDYACPLMGGQPCLGTKCMHFMFRQSKGDNNLKMTDPGHGFCGWLYVMAYFRDKNDNPNI